MVYTGKLKDRDCENEFKNRNQLYLQKTHLTGAWVAQTIKHHDPRVWQWALYSAGSLLLLLPLPCPPRPPLLVPVLALLCVRMRGLSLISKIKSKCLAY